VAVRGARGRVGLVAGGVAVAVVVARRAGVKLGLDVKDQGQVLVYAGLVGVFDDERAVEAPVHLPIRVEVRVIPEGPGLLHLKPIHEARPVADGLPAPRDPIHLKRHLEPVPMDGRARAEAVDELDLDGVAAASADRGAWVAPVVGVAPAVAVIGGRLQRHADAPRRRILVGRFCERLRAAFGLNFLLCDGRLAGHAMQQKYRCEGAQEGVFLGIFHRRARVMRVSCASQRRSRVSQRGEGR
jgi:hypothetical protein